MQRQDHFSPVASDDAEFRPRYPAALFAWLAIETDNAAVNRCLRQDYHAIIEPSWPNERRHVEEGCRLPAFPFPEIHVPAFELRATWTLGALLGYLRSWSSTARCRAAHGIDPVASFETRLAPARGLDETRRIIRWPLSLRVGRTTKRRIAGSTAG
jgi:hypothetical protein